MGKKKPQPEPVKLLRAPGENLSIAVTEEEKKYRNKYGPDDVTSIRREKLKCTVCAKSVADIANKGIDPYIHMVLGVLMCKDCASFYGDGYFSVDEDGDDKYCRWCGQGGTLYLCSTCSCAFCKKCIKQNLTRQDVKDLESDDWKCLICKPKPLFECRTICWALQEHAKAKKDSEDKVEESPSTRPKRDKAKKSKDDTNSNSKKRKISEIEDESESEKERGIKRKKSSDSVQENKKQKNVVTPTSSRRSINQSFKEKDDNDSNEEKSKSNSSRPKRSRGSQPEENSSPRKSSRSSTKQSGSPKTKEVEIIISDSEKSENEEHTKKKSKNHSPKKSVKKEIKKTSKYHDENEISQSHTEISSGTSSVAEKKDKNIVPDEKTNNLQVKRSQRSTKGKHSQRYNIKDSSKISIDIDSSSENDSKKTKFSRKKSENMSYPSNSLNLGKNADKKVIQASGYINSALKDVVELSVLISSRCEKLCSKKVQSTDDVLNVFTKLKQLMEGVHTNLELIEKGMDTKINGWRGIKVDEREIEKTVAYVEDKKTDEEVSGDKAPNIVQSDAVDLNCSNITGDEHKVNSEVLETEVMDTKENVVQPCSETKEESTETAEDSLQESMKMDNKESESPTEVNKCESPTEINKSKENSFKVDQPEEKTEESVIEEIETRNQQNEVKIAENYVGPPKNVLETSIEEKCSEAKKIESEEDQHQKINDISEEVEAFKESEDKQDTPGNPTEDCNFKNNESSFKHIIEEENNENTNFENGKLNQSNDSADEKTENENKGNETTNSCSESSNSNNETAKEDNLQNSEENSNEKPSETISLTQDSESRKNDDVNENKSDVLSDCKTSDDQLTKNNSIDHVLRPSIIEANDESQNNGFSDVELKNIDKEPVFNQSNKNELPSDDKKEEVNKKEEVLAAETTTESVDNANSVSIKTQEEISVEERTTKSVEDNSDTLLNKEEKTQSSFSTDSLENKEQKVNSSQEIRKEEIKEDRNSEKEKGEGKGSKTPTDDQKSSPRPSHQSHSGDRSRYQQRSNDRSRDWSRDRDRDRDRYQERGWSSSRGGSGWNQNRWHNRGGGGWGWNR